MEQRDPWGDFGAEFGWPFGEGDWPPQHTGGLPPWLVGRERGPQYVQNNNSGGGARGNSSMKQGRGALKNNLMQFLNQALQGGFPTYGGPLPGSASATGEMKSIYESFFGPGGGYNTAQSALSDIAQQDALGRAQLLLQPSMNLALDENARRSRQRASLGGNLFSTGGAEAEARGASGILGQQQETLANLIPQLTAMRLQAAGALPALAGQGMTIADTPRNIANEQAGSFYNEFLRTTPAGGPLEAIIAALTGTRSPNQGGSRDRGPTGAQLGLSFLGNLFGGPAGASLFNYLLKGNQGGGGGGLGEPM